MAFRCTLRTLLAKKMTALERQAALADANEKMRQYYVNRPPVEVLLKKKKAREEESLFRMAGVLSTFLAFFFITPFLGRKIARDEEFKKKYIPKWYDFTIEKPDYAWTRAELHEQMVDLKRELHERAIAGEFTAENLQEMRRYFTEADAKKEEEWGKLHPGVDDDEDIEDDD